MRRIPPEGIDAKRAPDKAAATVRHLKRDDRVWVVAERGEWAKVRLVRGFPTREVWVEARDLLPIDHTIPEDVPVPQPAAPAPEPAAAVGLQPHQVSGGLYLAGALALIVGSLMPWIVIQTALGSITASGVDRGDGLLTLAAGFAVGGLGLEILTKPGTGFSKWQIAFHDLVPAAAAGFAYFTVERSIQIASTDGYAATHGVGLWLLLIGTAVTWAGTKRAPRR